MCKRATMRRVTQASLATWGNCSIQGKVSLVQTQSFNSSVAHNVGCPTVLPESDLVPLCTLSAHLGVLCRLWVSPSTSGWLENVHSSAFCVLLSCPSLTLGSKLLRTHLTFNSSHLKAHHGNLPFIPYITSERDQAEERPYHSWTMMAKNLLQPMQTRVKVFPSVPKTISPISWPTFLFCTLASLLIFILRTLAVDIAYL